MHPTSAHRQRFSITHLLLVCCLLSGLTLQAAQAAVTWSKNFGASNNNTTYDVITDSNKNVYITGGFTGATLAFGGTTLTRIGTNDAFVAKLDSSGNVAWAKNFGGAGVTIDGRSVGVDGSGNVYVGGNFSGSNTTTPAMTLLGSSDYFVIKLDSSGNIAWSKNFGPGSTWPLNRSLYVDNSGNSFLVGSLTANWTTPSLTKIGASDGFIIKLDSSGNVVWGKNWGGAGGNARSWEVAVDSAGNVYTSGYFNTSNLTTPALTLAGGSLDAYLLKLDSSGNVLWSRAYGGAGASMTPGGLVTDSSNNVYAGFHFSGSNLTTPAVTKIGSQDALLMKIDSSGTTTWSRNYGGASATFNFNGLSLDNTGAPHVFGTVSGANLTTPVVTRLGSIDAVHISVDTSGTLVTSHNYGGTGATVETAGTGTVNSANNLLVAGAFSGANLTTPALTKVATRDVFVLCEDCVVASGPTTPPVVTTPYIIPVPSGVTFTAADPATVFGSGTSVMSQSLNGVVNIGAAPGTVKLNATAPANVVFQASPGIGQFSVQLPSGQEIKITPNETSTQFRLKYVTVDGVKTPVLQVIQGSATFVGSAANQIIASVLGGDSSTTLFVAGAAGASGQSGFDSSGNRIVTVTNGTATVSANGFSAAAPKLLYAGETAVFDSTGSFNRARVGSYSGNSGITGDPLSVSAGYPFQLTINAKTPKLSGMSNRLGKDLETSVLEQLTKAGYTSVSTGTNGVRVFTLNGASRRLMALGEVIVDTSRSDGVSTNTAGNLEVVSGGLVTTFAPALGSAEDLAALLQQADARFTLQHRSDGAYQGQISGRDYLARAGFSVTSDSGTAGLTINSDGSITLRDGKGNAQMLYPTFGDLTALKNQLLKINSGYTVQAAEDGSVTATLNGSSVKLVPDWQLLEAKSEHIGEGYWTGGPQFLLRLDNYTAQGVTVK